MMTRKTQVLAISAVVYAALFMFAFIAAPHSCEWGLAAYFWLGVAALIAVFAAPVALWADRTVLMRVAFGFGFAALCAAVWLAGLFAANVRILCRLF